MKQSQKKVLGFITAISFLLFSVGCGETSQIGKQDSFTVLKNKIDNLVNDSSFAEANWGIQIQSLKTGKIWYSKNQNKMFMPASNEKIPTAAAALTLLGPDFKFETDLCMSGEFSDSTLRGNLIIFGDGDPTLYTKFFKDPRDLFFNWAKLLKEKGIKNIDGNIIADDKTFSYDSLGFGWSFDGLDSWSYAQISPLQLNENYIDINIIPPDSITKPILIKLNIPSNDYKIINNITTSDSGRTEIIFSRQVGTNEIVLSGNVVIGSREFQISPTITNPPLFYVTVLKEVLEESGIEVNGNPITTTELGDWNYKPGDFEIIDNHKSAPLKDIIKVMMKRSQNLYAETLPRIIGLEKKNKGTFNSGKIYIREVLENFGIKPNTYRYMDGSGLSRYDYISPEEIVKILTAMWQSPNKTYWYDSLPIAGVDGTLQNRMKGTKAQGNVRAKTGTISNVRALSGYVTTENGEELVFSFLVNNFLGSSKSTENISDSILELLASFNSSY